MLHGADIVKVPGGYSNAYALCRQAAEKYGYFDATTTFINPYARDGYKTMGFEIWEQLGNVPDWIVIPVGAGPILASLYQAFDELKKLGYTDRLPRLACIQAENCGPIAKAFLNQKEKVEPCLDAEATLASGINDALDGYAEDGDYTLACIRKSGGSALLLSEAEIEESVRRLAREGIYAEPAGAVGMMGLLGLIEQGSIQKGQSAVMIITGHGLKNPLPVQGEIPVVSDMEQLDKYLQR